MMMFGNENITEACSVYCEGPILNAVQLAQIYNDSKTFVDMPMKYNPNATLEAFYNIADPSDPDQLRSYLDEYFLPAGSDLDEWVPTDFTQDPAFLATITDADYKQWGSDLNQLWLILGREVNVSVHQNPQRHSYVPRNYPMVVPGGRFRESYYWDSWWIVRGLLVCDMSTTARYVINNLLDDIEAFGFVPNGGRIYYLDRSQPPLLSEMIRSYYEYMLSTSGKTDDLTSFISSSYDSLVKEYSFWMSPANGHCMDMPMDGAESNPVSYQLNRFYSNYTTPRPESYLADYDNAHASSQSLESYYHQVRAGAETGWDFSSRWIREAPKDDYNITNIHTNEVVPADLNSIMYKFELNLAYFATQLAGWASASGNGSLASAYNAQAQVYSSAATLRSTAINEYLWDGQGKHWRDYNLTSQRWTHFTQQDAIYLSTLSADSADAAKSPESVGTSGALSAYLSLAYPADPDVHYNYSTIAYWVPMWAGLRPSDGTSNDDLVTSLQASNLLQPGGVLTSTINTGQQWDAPDAWPPEVMFTIEGLQNLNTHNSLNLADDITQLWLNTCYTAFNNTGYMYEKYNAYHVGVGGGGGEYKPQVGFGWSNAVALILLQEMYAPGADSGSHGLSGPDIIAISCAATFVVLVFAIWLYLQFYHPVDYMPSDRETNASSPGGAVDMRPIAPTASNPIVGEKGVSYV